ncbi:DUF6745 domain-containing protein [Streptomyces oceani]|uniref:DUF6745 domain-containing protein n=1 Tax=Streptomyces oceani TaxID=1075402 RepID=A0A1E7JXF9_9ACTN|nr:hypothetical protein [Streptomyces oceani]OEU96360.1 hypothetical protein AN216_21115 [Streptomyces oceani]
MRDLSSWRELAEATGAADRPAAEAGVRTAYHQAGLAEPARIVWADSPRAAVAIIRELSEADDTGPSVRDEIRTQPWAAARRRLVDTLGQSGWAARWEATGAQLWPGVKTLTDRVTTGLVAELTGRVGGRRQRRPVSEETARDENALRVLLLDAVFGQQDAAWLAAFDPPEEGPDPLAGLKEVAQHAGWWWPYARVAVVCERPVALHLDVSGRLDRADGPALAYPDGFALHSWRGMPVPADWHTQLAELTPERIRTEENAELRRIMLEHYGHERYLTDSGAKPVHQDRAGRLWRINFLDDEDVVMVEVVNSTAEPDGTHRTYWLRVPPWTRTATEGVAWTFDLASDEYAPRLQT